MQPDPGERRAQLVRSIGGKESFLLDGVIQPGEQLIQRGGDGTDFFHIGIHWQRGQVVRGTIRQTGTQLVQGAGYPGNCPEGEEQGEANHHQGGDQQRGNRFADLFFNVVVA